MERKHRICRDTEDDRIPGTREHHGGDLVNTHRQEDGHQVPVSGMEEDIVVSDNTTMAQSNGGKRGSWTGKVTTIDFIDDQCLANPDGPWATQRMIPGGEQSPLPHEVREETGIPPNPVLKVRSYPSTSPRVPPPTQSRRCVYTQSGACNLHGPGAQLRWKPRGKKTTVGEDGVRKTTMEKDYFYTCDLAP